METNARHVLIGLFTLLVGGGALLFALWLGKSSLDSSYDNYVIVFHEAVTGLSSGSPVQFNGIKVGEVVRHTDSGSGASQAEHWPATVDGSGEARAVTPPLPLPIKGREKRASTLPPRGEGGRREATTGWGTAST